MQIKKITPGTNKPLHITAPRPFNVLFCPSHLVCCFILAIWWLFSPNSFGVLFNSKRSFLKQMFSVFSVVVVSLQQIVIYVALIVTLVKTLTGATNIMHRCGIPSLLPKEKYYISSFTLWDFANLPTSWLPLIPCSSKWSNGTDRLPPFSNVVCLASLVCLSLATLLLHGLLAGPAHNLPSCHLFRHARRSIGAHLSAWTRDQALATPPGRWGKCIVGTFMKKAIWALLVKSQCCCERLNHRIYVHWSVTTFIEEKIENKEIKSY